MQVDIIPKTFDQLQSEATPKSVEGGNMEAVAWTIYDTLTYTSAVTTQATFFTNTRPTPQLSNLSPAGQFPNPQFFRVYSASLDIGVAPLDIGAAAPTAIRDVWRILFGSGTAGEGMPSWTFTIANKTYGAFPVSMLHGTGGPQGFGFTTAAAAGAEWANNSFPDGGYSFANSILIPPQQAFQVSMAWDAAQTLVADINLRLSLHGTLYRRIL